MQLDTRTKLFCPCALEFAAPPNSRVCPVCGGMPGALPVMNRRACDFAIRAGLALGCRVASFSKWDRKSYYYPDMPKNYQISQYDLPLSADGVFEIPLADGTLKRVGIIRAHLEEDAGKNLHEGLDHTRVDLNRAGTPLLEIVTMPDLASAEEARIFCVELQRLVRYLGISSADMQKGQMRFEPNVNVAITQDGREYRTPISEIKNLNSFRSVRLAIDYEINRQIAEWQSNHDYTLENVGKLNFGWNDAREITEFQRGKEESHDYRYFPDPDLLPVTTTSEQLALMREEIGELPIARRRRYMKDFGLTDNDCDIVLADRETARLFEYAVSDGADIGVLTRQFVGLWNNLSAAAGQSIGHLGLPAQNFSDLAKLVTGGAVSASAASQIAEHLYRHRAGPTASGDAGNAPASTGELTPADAARALGLIQERDESALLAWIDGAFAANPQAVQDALANPKKTQAAVGFLRGQVMKLSKGKADPKLAGELIEKKLAESRH